METALGAKLDSWADTGTYILAFLAIYLFKWEEIKQHLFPFILFLVVMIISYAIVFIKFKELIGLHTYLFKIAGYLQGAFIVILFLFGFYVWLYYVAIFCGIVACIEEIIIMLMLPTPQSNVKGLYWILKNRNK
jgi:CDP-diacylglycerol--glycerol-3-phosphate 3-phosphatidyltransferase